MNDDDLEHRLRNVLRSRRLSVDPDTELLDRVHAGARRRQQRRQAAGSFAGLAAVAAVALVAGNMALRSHDGPAVSADRGHLLSSSAASSKSPQPSSAKPSSINPVLPSTSSPSVNASPTAFSPLSVSAVSVNTYWVLGSAPCSPESRCLALRMTTDGGKTFTSLAAPALDGAPGGVGAKGWIAEEVRFGNAKTGWAYDSAGLANYFFQTTDGGTSWSPVKQMPGRVVDVTAANGTAWAVVDSAPANSTAQKYAIYSTSYDSGPQKWTRVALPFDDLGTARPSIVDQDGVVSLLVSGPLRAGDRDHVLVSGRDGSFTDHEGPCSQELGGYLSNSKKAIWAVCPTGMMAALFVSTDRGATWQAAKTPANFANPGAAIGAIDDHAAIVSDAATGALLRVGVDGPETPVSAPAESTIGANFIGFTDESTGFAIVQHGDGTSGLWRTTDGGERWSVVAVPAE